MQRFEHVIIGAGHTGIFLAKQLAALDMNVLIIEQYGVGGSSVHHSKLPEHILYSRAEEYAHNLKFFNRDETKRTELLKYRKKVFDYTKFSIAQQTGELEKELNLHPKITLLKGSAKFVKRNILEIVDQLTGEIKELKYGQIYICAGKNTLAGLKVEGIESVPVCHQWNYWKFKSIPKTISMIGFNQETLEKADMYSNFGIKVDIFEARQSWECFAEMDLTATNFLLKQLIRKQVDFNFDASITKVLHINRKFNIYLEDGYKHVSDQLYIPSTEVLNGDQLGLENVKLKFDSLGIKTDYQGHTNVSNIFAFGSIVHTHTNHNKSLENFLKFKELRTNRGSKNALSIVKNNLTLVEQQVLRLQRKDSTPTIQIKSTNALITIGLSEAMVRKSKRIKPISVIYEHPQKSGFVKIIYHPYNQTIFGYSSGGELAQTYGSFLKYAYHKNLKLSEVSNFIKFDLYSN
jgi:pyruvate/2-oxoglutarate dehydrogenase complex dihydrolipoamide dehydrogenase (E3) component